MGLWVVSCCKRLQNVTEGCKVLSKVAVYYRRLQIVVQCCVVLAGCRTLCSGTGKRCDLGQNKTNKINDVFLPFLAIGSIKKFFFDYTFFGVFWVHFHPGDTSLYKFLQPSANLFNSSVLHE